jgi:hypothetical protein
MILHFEDFASFGFVLVLQFELSQPTFISMLLLTLNGCHWFLMTFGGCQESVFL